jgi:thiol-disulfide isomerase/thioredoxin
MQMRKYILLVLMVVAVQIVHAQRIPAIKMAELAQYAANTDSVLVINFWATFCKPCVEEIPFMQRISRKYAGQKVKLLLVSLDVKQYYPAKLRSFVKKQGFRAPVVWLNETDADYFCPLADPKWSGAIPASLIINNKKGERRFYEQPFTPAEFEKELRAVLGL